jgi:hypothetical protein
LKRKKVALATTIQTLDFALVNDKGEAP